MIVPEPSELFEPGRLLAFSDGVFGVAITLLVIDLRLPATLTGDGDAVFLQALWDMESKLIVFAFTFIVVGMSWLGHHRKFGYIDKKGTIVINPQFDDAEGFQRGFARVYLGNKWGYIDTKGDYVWNPTN